MLQVNALIGFGTAQREFITLFNRGAGTFSDSNTSWSIDAHGTPAGPNVYRNSGKWYYEVTVNQVGQGRFVGIARATFGWDSNLGFNTLSVGYSGSSGNIIFNNSSAVTGGATYTTNDVMSVAFDLDNFVVYFAKNNVWQFGGNPSAGTGGYSIASDLWTPAISSGASAGSGTSSFTKANFGQWPKIYGPPTNYNYFE